MSQSQGTIPAAARMYKNGPTTYKLVVDGHTVYSSNTNSKENDDAYNQENEIHPKKAPTPRGPVSTLWVDLSFGWILVRPIQRSALQKQSTSKLKNSCPFRKPLHIVSQRYLAKACQGKKRAN